MHNNNQCCLHVVFEVSCKFLLDGGLGLKMSGFELKSHLGYCHLRGWEAMAHELGYTYFAQVINFPSWPEFRRCVEPAPTASSISGGLVLEPPPPPNSRSSSFAELVRS
jgi:hypothetical protein